MVVQLNGASNFFLIVTLAIDIVSTIPSMCECVVRTFPMLSGYRGDTCKYVWVVVGVLPGSWNGFCLSLLIHRIAGTVAIYVSITELKTR